MPIITSVWQLQPSHAIDVSAAMIEYIKLLILPGLSLHCILSTPASWASSLSRNGIDKTQHRGPRHQEGRGLIEGIVNLELFNSWILWLNTCRSRKKHISICKDSTALQVLSSLLLPWYGIPEVMYVFQFLAQWIWIKKSIDFILSLIFFTDSYIVFPYRTTGPFWNTTWRNLDMVLVIILFMSIE